MVRQRSARDRAVIVDILPRISSFSRRGAGLVTAEQVVAANIDTLFIVMGHEIGRAHG